jgi:hypothetical protein
LKQKALIEVPCIRLGQLLPHQTSNPWLAAIVKRHVLYQNARRNLSMGNVNAQHSALESTEDVPRLVVAVMAGAELATWLKDMLPRISVGDPMTYAQSDRLVDLVLKVQEATK